jgi:hypothetical protein
MQWIGGILAKSQAFFYASAFFWLDGFAVPAPAQVSRKEHGTGRKPLAGVHPVK